MKKLSFFLLGALTALLAASCDPHQFPTDGSKDFSVRLHFNFDLPVHQNLDGLLTKAKAAARPKARYNVQLFRYLGEYQYTVAPEYTFSFTRNEVEDLDTTLFLPVPPERYKILAWTDWVDASGIPYWDASDFNAVALAPDYSAGEFARDAFRGGGQLDLSGLLAAGLSHELTIEMTRPVARVRFIIADGLNWLSSKGLSASSLLSSLKWGAALPDRIDLFGDRSSGEREGASLAAVPYLDDEGALVLCVDHVLTGGDGLTVPATFSLRGASGENLGSWSGSVPMLRGHLTTVALREVTPTPPPGPDDPDVDKQGGIGIDPTFGSETEITF